VLVPLAAALWGRLRLADAFALRPGAWPAYPAAVLLGLGMVPLMYRLLVAMQAAGLTYLGPQQLQWLGGEVEAWRSYPAAAVVASMALIGMLEELFFRGYLLSGLRSAISPRAAVVVSAVLFGVFHSVSSFDRLLPSTVPGLVLGWLCWRSGSVVPGMLLHACYNGLWVYLAYQQGGRGEELSIEPVWLAAAAGGVALGGLLVVLCRPRRGDPAPEGR
jgi:sodium transport system permease protein